MVKLDQTRAASRVRLTHTVFRASLEDKSPKHDSVWMKLKRSRKSVHWHAHTRLAPAQHTEAVATVRKRSLRYSAARWKADILPAMPASQWFGSTSRFSSGT